MLTRFLSANNYLATHVMFTIFCSLIAFLLVGYPLIMTDSLYHDQHTLYSFYRNSFLSILHFGEIRWWDPTIQYGFPSYYFSFLGLYASTPLFWLTEGGMFILHLLGIRDINMHTVIVVYVSLLIPLLFNISFLTLTRQIFKTKTTLAITVIMAAFSPGLLYSVSEAGFGMTAYGMFVAAAMLAFIRNTSRNNYLLLNIALCVLLLSFNHPSLFWNPLFLIVFGSSLLLFPERNFKDILSDYISLPLWQHIFFAISTLISILPTTICYLAGSEIFRDAIGKKSTFDPLKIFGGDPLEFFLAGIPGFGTIRQGEVLAGFPQLIPSAYYLEYPYMGVLSIPLLLLGLTYGQKIWRHRLYFLMAFFAVAVLLGGKSGILSLLYLADSPLRSVRHFGDTTFRNGLFALLILGAGLGFEALMSARTRKIRTFFLGAGAFWLFLITVIVSSFLFLAQYGKVTADIPTIGYIATLVFFYIPVLFGLYLKPGVVKSLRILVCMIIFLDLTCSIYLFVRNQVLLHAHLVIDSGKPLSVLDSRMSLQENTALTLKDIQILKDRTGGVPELPYIGLVTRNGMAPIAMSQLSSMTFNSIEIKATAAEDTKLFWRDSWFNGWEATVNGRKVPIEKFMGAFKSVPVNSGASSIRFEFFPRPFVYSLILGWGTVLMLLTLAVTLNIKQFVRDSALFYKGLK